MATVNAINRPKGQTRGGVCAVLEYAMLPEKTVYEGRQLVTGLNCQPECCYTEFISTKLQYGKCDDKKMYFHFVQSFHPEEPITPEEAHAIALELAQQQWKDYEVIVATHTDRDHVHSHFVLNSVSFKTGRKFHFGKDDLTQLRKFSDELCMKHGLSVCEPRERQTAGIGQAEYHAALKGESWKIRLAIQIDECMKYAVNREQFIELMESEGYSVKWTDKRKSITYTNPDGLSCRDFKLHEEKYLKENMEYEFKIRAHQLFAHHGGVEGQTADGVPGESGQSIKHPEVGHADGIQLDRADQRSGADRTGGPQAAGDGGAADHSPAAGREAQRPGEQPVLRTYRVRGGDAGKCAAADDGQRQQLELDAGDDDGYGSVWQDAAGEPTEGIPVTGWERQRELLFASLRCGGGAGQTCQFDDVEDVSSHRDFSTLGIGAASVLAGLTVLEGQDEDPEERRREMEAREAAQNVGALVGLTASAAIAVRQKLTGDEPVQEEEPEWTGPTMKLTM